VIPIEIIAASHVAATLLVDGIHAWLILLGLRAMRRASDSRDQAMAAQTTALLALVRQADANTAALRILIERTDPANRGAQ